MPPSSRTGTCGEVWRACFTRGGPGRARRRWCAARAPSTFVTRSAWRKSPGNQPVPFATSRRSPAAPIFCRARMSQLPSWPYRQVPRACLQESSLTSHGEPIYLTGCGHGGTCPAARRGGAGILFPPGPRRPGHCAADRTAVRRCGHPAARQRGPLTSLSASGAACITPWRMLALVSKVARYPVRCSAFGCAPPNI
jgi:hypothetical protein